MRCFPVAPVLVAKLESVAVLLLAFGTLVAGPAVADTTFGSEQIVVPDLNRASGVTTADLDGDDDLDVLTHGFTPAAYALNEGDAASWTVVDLPDGSSQREIDALDVDGDGHLDIVISDWQLSQLIWYPNEFDASGGLGDAQVVCSGCRPDQFEMVDLDGDLDPDFVVAQRSANTFTWYENEQGDASSWVRHDLDGGDYGGPKGVDVNDVDGDGDLDVVGADEGGHLVWFENLGGAASWMAHDVASGVFIVVQAVDFDFDGDIDFVTQRRNPAHDPTMAGFIEWFENTAGDGSTFTVHLVDATQPNFGAGIQAIDLDFDQDLDIVGHSAGNWLENVNGDGLTWTLRSYQAGTGIRDTAVADLDRDGDIDILGARLSDDRTSWWPNQFCTEADDDDDGDGARDPCERCPGEDDFLDADGDTVPDGCDICPIGDDRVDTDGNDIPDACEGEGTLSIDDVTAFETDSGTVSFTFTVTHTGTVDDPFTVDYQTQDGDDDPAEADGDYLSTSGTLSFDGAYLETRTVVVTVNGDLAVEVDETFTVELGMPTNPAVTVTDGSGLGTIQNDDASSISIADVSQAEGDSGGTTFLFAVTLDAAVQGGVSVDYTTANGTATVESGDYATATGTLGFDGTENEVEMVSVTVQGDGFAEDDESFAVNLSNVSEPDVTLSDSYGEGTILNDDSASVAIDDVSMAEGDSGLTTYTFTVGLTGDVESSFTVDYETVDGSATTDDGDYIDRSGTLVFDGTNGDTETVTVDVEGDTVVESDEVFLVLLDPPSDSHVTRSDGTGLGTIDNDDKVTLTIDDPSVVEGAGGSSPDIVFTVTLSGDHPDGFSVPFETAGGSATGGADYSSTSGSLAFSGSDGETQAVTVSVIGDDVVEGDESFEVELQTPSDSRVDVPDDTGVGTIQDDDAATIVLGDATQGEGDSGSVSLLFSVALTGDVQGGFTVGFNSLDGSASTSDGDYVGAAGVLTFAGSDGETEIVEVSVQGDEVTEMDETLTVALDAPSKAGISVSGSGLGTILNDDSAAIAIGDLSASEGDGGPVGFAFTVTLNGAVDEAFTVDFTTTDGTATSASGDYDATSGTVSFDGAPGEQETLTVVVNGDMDPEEDETFTVTLDPPSSSLVSLNDGTAQGLIANDDFLLSVSVVGSGHVDSDPAGIDCGDGATDCEEVYAAETVVDLTPTPVAGWEFTEWSGDSDCEDGSVTLNRDTDCVATFQEQQAQIDVAFEGGGFAVITSTPTGIACDRDGDPFDCSASFDAGTTVDLEIEVTSADTTFDGWSGDADCEDGSVDVDAGESVACVAILIVTPLFTDGFESSDTSAWSLSVP